LRFTVYDETFYKPSDNPHASSAGIPRFLSYSQGGHSRLGSTLSTSYFLLPNAASLIPPIVNTAKPENMIDGVRKACCSTQSAKENVPRLVTNFKYDLDNILATNFIGKQTVSQSPMLPSPSPALSPEGHNGSDISLPPNLPLCSVCALGKRKSWIICDYCQVMEVCR
jgi:next-to-BRCA1 protein 1